mgnify:CR=1 FL=1
MRILMTAALAAAVSLPPQPPPSAPRQQPPPALRPPARADILRGEYGRYRANNDLLFYHLKVRVNPDTQHIAGSNLVRFRMLQDDTRIQLDLYANMAVDRILFNGAPLTSEQKKGVADVTRATAGFREIQTAKGAGYTKQYPAGCAESPDGAQGFHYLNESLVDEKVELLRPELVMYEPQPNGTLKLIGVDYVVPLTSSATPPM